MDRSTITAIILTHNEEQHIERCIASLSGIATRVCIVDSFSSDNTISIAKSMGAEVCQNKWINYSNQFTWALNNLDITDAWTLRIDADEYIDEKLRNQIKSFVQEESNHNCAIFKRKIVFLGKEIIHGNFYPLLMLRLWKTGQ